VPVLAITKSGSVQYNDLELAFICSRLLPVLDGSGCVRPPLSKKASLPLKLSVNFDHEFGPKYLLKFDWKKKPPLHQSWAEPCLQL
jgi:hypothetical protein